MPHCFTQRQYLRSACEMALALAAIAAMPAVAQERYMPSADGQEISDNKTGLIWRRCAEGMALKGKVCTGQAIFANQADAAARAKSAAVPGQDWRLPTMKELSGIVAVREAEEGKAAIDPVIFPATPPARFWSSSSVGPGYFMYVGFIEGSAGEGARNMPGAIRLVRNAK